MPAKNAERRDQVSQFTVKLETSRLIDVSLEHRRNLAQVVTIIPAPGSRCETVLEVIVDNFFPERLQAPSRGNDLVQNFCAIVVARDHLLYAFELSGDLSQADLQSATVGFRVFGRVGHSL